MNGMSPSADTNTGQTFSSLGPPTLTQSGVDPGRPAAVAISAVSSILSGSPGAVQGLGVVWMAVLLRSHLGHASQKTPR